jgi:hypothetical protein
MAANDDLVVVGYALGEGIVLRVDGGNGSLVWALTLGSGSFTSAVAMAANGDVVVVGSAASFGPGVLVLRLDGGNGSIVWARTWGGFDLGYAVDVADNGDVVVAGITASFGAGGTDVLVLRLDGGNGSVVWARTCGTSSEDVAKAVAVAANGDVVVAGSRVDANVKRMLVLRLDGGNGSVVWARAWGNGIADEGFAVAVAANGDVVAAGSSFGAATDVLVLRLDGGNGSVVWARTWGGRVSESARAVAMATNGDVVVAGSTNSFGAGSNDMTVLRLDGGDGSVLWVRTWGGSSSDEALAAAVAGNGDLVVAGFTSSFGAASLIRALDSARWRNCSFRPHARGSLNHSGRVRGQHRWAVNIRRPFRNSRRECGLEC